MRFDNCLQDQRCNNRPGPQRDRDNDSIPIDDLRLWKIMWSNIDTPIFDCFAMSCTVPTNGSIKAESKPHASGLSKLVSDIAASADWFLALELLEEAQEDLKKSGVCVLEGFFLDLDGNDIISEYLRNNLCFLQMARPGLRSNRSRYRMILHDIAWVNTVLSIPLFWSLNQSSRSSSKHQALHRRVRLDAAVFNALATVSKTWELASGSQLPSVATESPKGLATPYMQLTAAVATGVWRPLSATFPRSHPDLVMS